MAGDAKDYSKMDLKIGHGYDIHRLVPGRKLLLGTVEIPYKLGLLGHSDADCVCHAITDALLGALALPNIGQLYPDSDQNMLGIASSVILQEVYFQKIVPRGYRISNLDCTLIAQEPKLNPYLEKMRKGLSSLLELVPGQVNIKVTTNEGLDAIGHLQAIACHTVCLLIKKD